MLYAVPYAVAYAPQMMKAYGLLWEAAGAVESCDPEFAGHLRNRARDLLSNDYESGDASWVRGRFQHLNAQIGAYEVYDDELFGAKAFYSLSVLIRDDAATARLEKAMQGLQAFENSLPYEPHKTVSTDIPVGVYQWSRTSRRREARTPPASSRTIRCTPAATAGPSCCARTS